MKNVERHDTKNFYYGYLNAAPEFVKFKRAFIRSCYICIMAHTQTLSLSQRPLHILFILFFASHILATIAVDAQSLIGEFYPQQLRDVLTWYIERFQDPLVAPPVAWWFNVTFRCMLVI